MHEKLLSHISRFVSLSAREQQQIADAVSYRDLPRRQLLLKASQTCDSLYFVLSGSLRFYGIKKNDTEQVLQFALPDWWMSDYQSLESRMPSGHYIDAIDDSAVLVLERKKRDELFDRIPLFERYFRLLMQRGYAASLQKVNYLFTGSREEMYRQFVTRYPDFVQQVPQYMLASFLGMTPEFLSKIRGKKIS